jgi:hypothetical protein
MQEVLVRLRIRLVLASGRARDLADGAGTEARELVLAGAAFFDVRLDGIALRAAELFGEQSFQLRVGGAPG